MLWASMISLFIPAFLYSFLGLPIWQIMIFMAVMSSMNVIISVFVSGPLLQRFTPKSIMIVWVIFFSWYLFLLYLSQTYYWYIYLAPIIAWIYNGLFRVSFNYNSILEHKNNPNFDKTYVDFAIFSNIGIAFGPFIWWYITFQYGIVMTLWIATILVILSIIPLIFYKSKKENNHRKEVSIKEFLDTLWFTIKQKKTKTIYKTFLMVAYNNIIAGVVWPLLIFLFVHEFQKIWFISTITTIITILILYILSRLQQNKKHIKVVTIMQSLNRNAWAIFTIIGFLISPIIIFIDTIQKILSNINDNTLDELFFDYADNDDSKEYSKLYVILLRDISLHGSKIWLFLILAIIHYYYPVSIFTLIVPMMITVLLVKLSWEIIKANKQL